MYVLAMANALLSGCGIFENMLAESCGVEDGVGHRGGTCCLFLLRRRLMGAREFIARRSRHGGCEIKV